MLLFQRAFSDWFLVIFYFSTKYKFSLHVHVVIFAVLVRFYFLVCKLVGHFMQVAVFDWLTDWFDWWEVLSVNFTPPLRRQLGCFSANDNWWVESAVVIARRGVTGFAGRRVNRSQRVSWVIAPLSSTPAAAAVTSLWRIPWRCTDVITTTTLRAKPSHYTSSVRR